MPRATRKINSAVKANCPKCGVECCGNGNRRDGKDCATCDSCNFEFVCCEPKHRKRFDWNSWMGAGFTGCCTYIVISVITLIIAGYTLYSLENNVRISGFQYSIPHWGMSGERLFVLWTLVGVTLLAWFAADSVFNSIRCGKRKGCPNGIDWTRLETVAVVLLVVFVLIIPLAGFYLLSPFAVSLTALGALLIATYILFNQRKFSNSTLGTIFLIMLSICLAYMVLLAGHVASIRLN